MNIKERLTNDILQSLENGETPIWKKSRNSFQISWATWKTYNGFNQLLLQHMKVKKKLGTN